MATDTTSTRYSELRNMMVEGHNYKADGQHREWHMAKMTGKMRRGVHGDLQAEVHDPCHDPQHPRKWLNLSTFTGTLTDKMGTVIKVVEGRRTDGHPLFNL